MKIFLAVPFNTKINEVTKKIDQEYKNWLMDLMFTLENAGHTYLSSHVRENWGDALAEPEEALRYDIEFMNQADLIVVVIDNPPSPGVQFEIGYSFAKNKKIIIAKKVNDTMPYLLQGFVNNPLVKLLTSENDSSMKESILDSIRSFNLQYYKTN
jgi:nucleoside 2-deoxyribosyltransferase